MYDMVTQRHLPSFTGLFIHTGHALTGCEVDGARAGGVGALPMDDMAASTNPLTFLHSLPKNGQQGTNISHHAWSQAHFECSLSTF